MKKRLAKLPSPAMAVAFVALLAALTGTAVALPGSNTVGIDDMRSNSVGKAELRTGSTGKAEILSRAVGSAEVINNSLGGADVNEGRLGTVPRANSAGSANVAGAAGFAGNAGATDGVSFADINYRVAEEAPDTTIFNQGGLQLVANCIADDLEITATNSGGGLAQLHVDGRSSSDVVDFEEDDNLNPGDTENIEIADDDSNNVTIHFGGAAANVTVHATYEEDADISPGGTGCAVVGYAVIS